MLKLLENQVKTQLKECFFQNFELGNIFEKFGQKSQRKNMIFFTKKSLSWHFLALFGQHFQNYCLN